MNATIENLRDRYQEYAGDTDQSPEWFRARFQELRREASTALSRLQPENEEYSWLQMFLNLLDQLLGERLTDGSASAAASTARCRVSRNGMPGFLVYFVGRDDELTQLDRWLADDTKRIITIVGAGGFGKTQLVNQWMRRLEQVSEPDRLWGGLRGVFCWCFYTAPGRTPTSVEEFLTRALQFFRSVAGIQTVASRHDRHNVLAEHIGSGNFLIVLDGLEALQKRALTSVDEDEGDKELQPDVFLKRYKQMAEFLKAVAKATSGKVVITSRQPLKELAGMAGVEELAIEGVKVEEGAQILKRLGVQGSADDLKDLVRALVGHPLSLGLAARALAWDFAGLASQWQQLRLLGASIGASEIADEQLIVKSYQKWLGASPEMELLRLVGFFSKRQIPREDLEVLLNCGSIRPLFKNLWNAIAPPDMGTDEINWMNLAPILETLQTQDLLLRNEYPDETGLNLGMVFQSYDAHPLLRGFYRDQLRAEEKGRYWREGQRALFTHYRKQVEGAATNEAEALLLYEAIGYACEAELFQEAFEIYWRRVQHNDPNLSYRDWWFAWKRLGLYSDDLGVLGWFFSNPWEKLHSETVKQLAEDDRNWLRYAVAVCLRQQGYETEAGHPLNASLDYFRARQGRMLESAMLAGQECERQLIRGKFDEAFKSGQQALDFAHASGDARQILSKYGLLGDVHLQKGEWTEARGYFDQVQEVFATYLSFQELDPATPIGGLTGFLFGDFRLCRAEIVLGAWDPEGKFLGAELPSREAAHADLRAVETEAERYLRGSVETVSVQDRALHTFLRERARAIENVHGGHEPDSALELGIHDALTNLYDDFLKYSRGDLPRLLVKRSKILRRLRMLGINDVGEDDPLVVAVDCLDEAADIAEYGDMALFEADIALERSKVFLARSRYPDRKFGPPADSLKLARDCWREAKALMDSIGYEKRRAELDHLKQDLNIV